jgi:cytochrome P450 PksS
MTSAAQKHPINPVSQENLLDPLPLYRELRENDPVHWSDVLNAWVMTRHDDVTSCYRDPRLSADRMKFFEYQLRGLGEGVVKEYLESARLHITMKDGAEHLRIRRRANAGFTPQLIDSWLPAIHQLTERLVERVRLRGHMDMVADLSYQLPPLVIAEVLGIPPEDHERLLQWATASARFASPTVGMDMAQVAREANDAVIAFNAYLGAILEQRRQRPGNDVLSRMLHVQEEGAMTPEELVANCLVLLVAGHISTTDQLSNGLYDLLTHPDQLRKLQKDPGLMGSAVEEMLRFSPAVCVGMRVVTESFELRGRTLQQGQVVLLAMSAANRDPGLFTDPDRFDITRDATRSKHLTFGFGPHHCLGASLARKELEIAFRTLLERLPGLRLDAAHPPQRKCHNLMFRGFESLHIRW